MPLKLMYITNDAEVAKIAESAGVDRIFVDLEYIGKDLRQGGMDTVQNRHTVEDIMNIRKTLTKSKLLVRVNPMHEATPDHESSESEITRVADAGADIIMLPYFKTAAEVSGFVKAVGGRSKTMLLFETPESVKNINEILSVEGIDEVYIGLNDLSLGYGYKFMFKPLANGMVDNITARFKQKGLCFGFGGIASLGKGAVPSEMIIAEHYRLGSTCAILSRSFCNTSQNNDTRLLNNVFNEGISEIRQWERYCKEQSSSFFEDNSRLIKEQINNICGEDL